jgi:hypothetical protein
MLLSASSQTAERCRNSRFGSRKYYKTTTFCWCYDLTSYSLHGAVLGASLVFGTCAVGSQLWHQIQWRSFFWGVTLTPRELVSSNRLESLTPLSFPIYGHKHYLISLIFRKSLFDTAFFKCTANKPATSKPAKLLRLSTVEFVWMISA